MDQVAEFQLGIVLDAKAVADINDAGDLYIEGYASDYQSDRDGEMFEPGAVNDGLKEYLNTNPILCYHHQFSKALGQVEEARIDDHGVWVRARIDKPTVGSWAEDIYAKVKRGTIRAFSIGGKFHRKAGGRIHKADIAEISVTPLPINPRTLFAVAGKAFGETADYDKLESTVASVEETLSKVETILSRQRVQ